MHPQMQGICTAYLLHLKGVVNLKHGMALAKPVGWPAPFFAFRTAFDMCKGVKARLFAGIGFSLCVCVCVCHRCCGGRISTRTEASLGTN